MQIDKFRAPTLQQALDEVHKRWGPKAAILHVARETIPARLFGKSQDWIEVTARAPEEGTEPNRAAPVKTASVEPEVPAGAPVLEQISSLREALADCRNIMRQFERSQWAKAQVESKPLTHPLFDFMIEKGFSAEFALELLTDWTTRTASLDLAQCMDDLDRRLHRLQWKDLFPPDEGRCTLFFGLPGSGKTLLLIKTAARLCLARQESAGPASDRGADRVMLVSADMSRPGPSHELALYSEILQVPLVHIFDLAELRAIAQQASPQRQILVDWNGISPYNPKTWQPLETLKDYHPHPQMLLTASLASDLRNWRRFRERLSGLPLVGLALTQADLEHRLGKIWEAARGTNLPIALISTGKNVPGDFFEGGNFAFGRHFFSDYPSVFGENRA